MENLPAEYDEQLPEDGGALLEVAKAKGIQTIQAMVIMAKKFPRNTVAAEKRILDACKRKGLAEVSQYSFPRGGQSVEGPSIRLAEVLAQNWGNLEYGIIEVDRSNGVSTMEAFCWDLETNVRKTQQFQVAHIRNTKRGSNRLTDERDIYEMTANQGSRRVRACILAVIPGDIVELAIAQCDKTMAGGDKPMKERIAEMVKQFEKFEVTQEIIEKFLGHPLAVERTTEPEMLRMRKVYLALQDKVAKPEDYFMMPKSNQPAAETDLQKRVKELALGVNENPPAVETPPAAPVPGFPGIFETSDAPKLNGEN